VIVRGKSAGAGRVDLDYGLDLSFAERKRVTTPGTSIKFHGTYPTTMGYAHATYGGILMKGNMFATTLSGNDAGKTYARILSVEGAPIGASECAAGAFRAVIARASTYPFGTTGTGGWGGASDMGARIEGYNYALSGSAKGGLQTLRVYAYNAPGGSLSNLLGCEISVYDRGEYASDGYSSDNVTTLIVSQRCRSVVKTRTNLLVVDDRSDGSHSLTTCYATAMIRLHSEGGASFGARASGIHFGSAGTGTGWTNAFSFQTAAGKEGFTAIADGDLKGKVNGYIKVYDVATGQTLYLNCYDTVPS